MFDLPINRRAWLGAALTTGACGLPMAWAQPARKSPIRIAAINSIFRYKSHSYHILGRLQHGYAINGVWHQPNVKIVRMLNDQTPPEDRGAAFCKQYGIELCSSVEQALGGDRLDVDGVLSIIEHGDYLQNEFQQVLYPRYEYFEKIVAHFRRVGRSVPVFNDKQLSYDYAKARQMVQWSKELKFGFMAGSSLPVTWRVPELDPPIGTAIQEGMVVYGYDRGPLEIYLIHALETLQCVMERRSAKERGVKRVIALEGNAVWQAADRGEWPKAMVTHVLRRSPSNNVGPITDAVMPPTLVIVEYVDGAKGYVLNLPEQLSEFHFVGRLASQKELITARFELPAPPGAKFFDPLVYNIEQLLQTGVSPYPVERTLLTSTLCDLAIRSLKTGQPMTQPELAVEYAAPTLSTHFRGRWTDE